VGFYRYYGCISLVQSVAEAITKFLAKENSLTPNREYKKLIAILMNKKIITPAQASNFKIIWKKRNSYHHLNNDVSSELEELRVLSREKIEKLKSIESEIFSFTHDKGTLIPDNPRYWRKTGNQVFLRLD
jgi:uncharacterized protein YutE (UPF0331/DUF86 family)